MIRFEKLRYKNILSVGNVFTEISLDRSKTTLIIGKNGHGKSTMIEALCFALYGRPFRDINKPLLVNSIIGKHLLVEVEFKTDGKAFKIVRGIKPNRFEIYKDGNLINQNDLSVDYQRYLENDVLRMNYKSFRQIVVLGSASYTPFMQLKSPERRIICEDILDIHVFSAMFSVLRKQIEETNDQIRDILDSIERNKLSLGIHEEHLSSKQEDYDQIVGQIQKSIDAYLERIDTLEEEIAGWTSQQNQYSQEIADQNKVATLLEQLRMIERNIEDRVMKYNEEIRFYGANHVCPTCSQDIDDEFKETTICKHTEQIKTLEKGIDEVEGKKLEISAKFDRMTEIANLITDIGNNIRDNNTEISLINGHIHELNDQLAEAQEKHDHKVSQSAISALSRAVKNDEEIRRQLMANREIQEYALVLLKDTGIKARVIKKYIPLINKLINKYLAVMGLFVTFELNEQFQETIRDVHKEQYTYNSFSEGEKMRINLAILFSWRDIAKMRNSMSTNLLIMDETFDSSLDEEGVEELVKILEEITGDTNVFVISHKSLMFDKFRSVIEFKKEKNFSRIVKDSGAS